MLVAQQPPPHARTVLILHRQNIHQRGFTMPFQNTTNITTTALYHCRGSSRQTRPPHRPTQSPALVGIGNEYRPKCCDALRLWIKGKGNNGSFHLCVIPR